MPRPANIQMTSDTSQADSHPPNNAAAGGAVDRVVLDGDISDDIVSKDTISSAGQVVVADGGRGGPVNVNRLVTGADRAVGDVQELGNGHAGLDRHAIRG